MHVYQQIIQHIPLYQITNFGLNLLKACANVNIQNNISQIMIFIYDRVENIVGIGENADIQHFLLIQQCFQKLSPTWDLVVKGFIFL